MTAAAAPAKVPDLLALPTMSQVPRNADGSPVQHGTVDVMLVPVATEGGGEQLVCLAFTSVPLLVEALGQEQAWVMIPTQRMEKALQGSGAQGILVDPQLADGARGGRPND
ncbi:SAV_915 family protein [Streptomyces sp. NPDC020898]|uniref:SAV_915 family protein n=1 Tax=Streptomyces sp. NPDC020898 TaxID=3365101 RepID=UPI003789B7E5